MARIRLSSAQRRHDPFRISYPLPNGRTIGGRCLCAEKKTDCALDHSLLRPMIMGSARNSPGVTGAPPLFRAECLLYGRRCSRQIDPACFLNVPAKWQRFTRPFSRAQTTNAKTNTAQCRLLELPVRVGTDDFVGLVENTRSWSW